MMRPIERRASCRICFLRDCVNRALSLDIAVSKNMFLKLGIPLVRSTTVTHDKTRVYTVDVAFYK